MKYIYLLFVAAIALSSCSKTVLAPENKRYDYQFKADSGHDNAIFNSAYFCFPADYKVKDGILHVILDHPIDSVNHWIGEHQIYSDPVNGLIDPLTGKNINRYTDQIDPLKLYDRNYWFIKEFIKLTVISL